MISEGINTHVTRDVRKVLDPLAMIAERTGAVIFGIAHFNKSSGTDVASLLSGSHAFRDVPRRPLRVREGRIARHPGDDPGKELARLRRPAQLHLPCGALSA